MGEKQPFQISGMLFFFPEAVWGSPLGALLTLEGEWKGLGTLCEAFQSYKAKTLSSQYEPGKNNCTLIAQ